MYHKTEWGNKMYECVGIWNSFCMLRSHEVRMQLYLILIMLMVCEPLFLCCLSVNPCACKHDWCVRLCVHESVEGCTYVCAKFFFLWILYTWNMYAGIRIDQYFFIWHFPAGVCWDAGNAAGRIFQNVFKDTFKASPSNKLLKKL